jgi:hypothetical protein
MKTLIDNQGTEFNVSDVTFEKVKKAFNEIGIWMLLIRDVLGITHSCLESENRERVFYQRNYK